MKISSIHPDSSAGQVAGVPEASSPGLCFQGAPRGCVCVCMCEMVRQTFNRHVLTL